MWKDIAEELGVPWKAAEEMHWVLGKQEMTNENEEFQESSQFTTPTQPGVGTLLSHGKQREGLELPRIRPLDEARELPNPPPLYLSTEPLHHSSIRGKLKWWAHE